MALHHVLCDNERFLSTKVALIEHSSAGVVLWQVPPRSPDLNPIERYWAWLKKKLRAMDLADATAKRKPLSKSMYRERIRRVIKSSKSQTAAKNQARKLRHVCREVVKRKGAATPF